VQMNVEDTDVRRKVKAESENLSLRFNLVLFLIQFCHNFFSKLQQSFQNSHILDIESRFNMFLRAGQYVCFGCC